MRLAEHTWTDIDAEAVDVALLPVGSTEQHGPHAPLGTDTALAEAVASRGAAHTEATVVVAPAIQVGVAEEHRGFSGTLWVSPETFRATIRDVVGSFAHHGWERVVVVNGHGGNVGALAEVCARLTRDEVARCVPFTWFNAVDLAPGELGHGGAVETAAMLAVHRELVHTDRLERAREGGAERWGRWVRGVNLAYDSDEFTQNGVVGDPSAASATTGEELLAEAGEALSEVIAATIRTD